MQTRHIAKTLAVAAISTLTLISGASQANGWGQYQQTYAPHYPDRPGLDRNEFDRRGPYESAHASIFDIDARQQAQMEKIVFGLRNGKLTRYEARPLMQEQRDIERLQYEFLADRRLSRNEWRELDDRLDRAQRNIRAEFRDGDRR